MGEVLTALVEAHPETREQIFAEELDIARIADDAGFDSVWTIEHHFTPYTMVTNPLQYLTYVAGITSSVDLGTMVTVLPVSRSAYPLGPFFTVTSTKGLPWNQSDLTGKHPAGSTASGFAPVG